MEKFKFTKSYISNERDFQKLNTLNDISRLEKIYQNMQQKNDKNEKLNIVKQEQQIDNLSDRMSALKNINRNQ